MARAKAAVSVTASPARAYGGESLADRVRARRERLLDAGLDLLGREGLSATTVRAVCGAAGLNQRYYYESFRDAHDLLAQIYTRELGRLEDAIVRSVDVGQPLSVQVRQATQAYFGALGADPRMARVVLFEVLGVSQEVDAVHRAGSQRFEALVEALITAALPGPSVPGLDLSVLSQAVVGAMISMAGSWVLTGFGRDQRDIVDSIVFVFEAVLEKLSRERAKAR